MSNRDERDGWAIGPNFLDQATLAALQAALEESPVIVEHRHYRGASAPERRIFDEYEDVRAYLATAVRAGDAIWVWRYDRVCTDRAAVLHGKLPDAEGAVPARGAY